jgi:hypothetical protein
VLTASGGVASARSGDGSAAAGDARRLLLWGDERAGKTTLLAAALYGGGESRLARMVDRESSAGSLNTALLPTWRRVARGLGALPTGQDAVELVLGLRDGGSLVVRDVRGSLARRLDEVGVIEEFRAARADAVLLVLEWDGRDLTDRMTAVTAALDLIGSRPHGLAITKCERALAETDRRWFTGAGWWRDVGDLARHGGVLERFGDAVWPCSAYGYHREQGVPAVLLGEFGQLIPFEVRPVGVAEPFDWALGVRGTA